MKIFLATCFLALTLVANAATIYDTYGTGDSYDTGTGWSVNSHQSIATPFTVGSAMNLTSVRLALSGFADYTVTLAVGGSTAPGATLESWSVIGGGNVTLTPASTLALAAGDYYIVAESSDFGGWFWNDTSHVGPFSFTSSSNWLASNGTTGVMRIEAEPVPEPMTMLALGIGALGVARRRRSS